MAEFRLGYVSVREIEPLVGLIRKIQRSGAGVTQVKVEEVYKSGVERLLKLSPYNKNVFIMTPFRDDARYREQIRIIKDELS